MSRAMRRRRGHGSGSLLRSTSVSVPRSHSSVTSATLPAFGSSTAPRNISTFWWFMPAISPISSRKRPIMSSLSCHARSSRLTATGRPRNTPAVTSPTLPAPMRSPMRSSLMLICHDSRGAAAAAPPPSGAVTSSNTSPAPDTPLAASPPRVDAHSAYPPPAAPATRVTQNHTSSGMKRVAAVPVGTRPPGTVGPAASGPGGWGCGERGPGTR